MWYHHQSFYIPMSALRAHVLRVCADQLRTLLRLPCCAYPAVPLILFSLNVTLLFPYFSSSHLPCCALKKIFFFRTYPASHASRLSSFSFTTYLAAPLIFFFFFSLSLAPPLFFFFFFALTLLCPYFFFSHTPCCAFIFYAQRAKASA